MFIIVLVSFSLFFIFIYGNLFSFFQSFFNFFFFFEKIYLYIFTIIQLVYYFFLVKNLIRFLLFLEFLYLNKYVAEKEKNKRSVAFFFYKQILFFLKKLVHTDFLLILREIKQKSLFRFYDIQIEGEDSFNLSADFSNIFVYNQFYYDLFFYQLFVKISNLTDTEQDFQFIFFEKYNNVFLNQLLTKNTLVFFFETQCFSFFISAYYYILNFFCENKIKKKSFFLDNVYFFLLFTTIFIVNFNYKKIFHFFMNKHFSEIYFEISLFFTLIFFSNAKDIKFLISLLVKQIMSFFFFF